MQHSSSIDWIQAPGARWFLFRNRSYKAQIQLADPNRIYNAPDRPGVVYNFLEDAYETVTPGGYVITGLAGEMWPIGAKSVSKYRISPEEITAEPQFVLTRELPDLYAGIMVPRKTEFRLIVSYGNKSSVLHGNRPDIAHGYGDWVLVPAAVQSGRLMPDFSDSGRVINGSLFDKLYRPVADLSSAAMIL